MTRLDEDLDENRSVWAATAAPIEPCPALSGDVTADVVIIGGGFTGISTAYHLIRRFPNKRVVLLEARRIGNGASGRSGGMALNWINGVHRVGMRPHRWLCPHQCRLHHMTRLLNI